MGCSIDHLPGNCLLRPKEDKGKEQSSLLYVEVIPSPNTSEEELETASLKVVTRAQAQQKAQVQTGNAAKIPKNTKGTEDYIIFQETP